MASDNTIDQDSKELFQAIREYTLVVLSLKVAKILKNSKRKTKVKTLTPKVLQSRDFLS